MNPTPPDASSEPISPWSEAADLAALGAAFTQRLQDPLHAIRLFNEAVERRVPEVAATTREIDQAAEDLARVFRALQEYLCAPRATSVWVSAERLDAIVHDVVDRCAEPITVVTGARDAGVEGIRLDAESFSRVVHEAVDNAIRHGGGRRGLGWSIVGETSRLQVWDEGSGVPEWLGNRVFLPLVSVSGQRPGMGLAWVNRFLCQVDGSVLATHEEGRFTLSIEFPTPIRS